MPTSHAIQTAADLREAVLGEFWRGVYGERHGLIGAKLWRPVCHACGEPLAEMPGRLARYACGNPLCVLHGIPAPADMGMTELRTILDADEVLAARLPEGYRTSQQRAYTHLGETFTLVVGGNRSGKSEGAAQLCVAFAHGRNHPATRVWALDNGFDLAQIPNTTPGICYAIALTHGDSARYVRPKLKTYLPKGTVFSNWTNTNDAAVAHLPGPNGEAPDPKASPGEPGFYGRIHCLAVKQGRQAFQGHELVFAWFDEEPLDEEVTSEVETRLIDRAGKMIFSLTPLSGYTHLYEKFVRNRDPRAVVHDLSGIHNPTGEKVRALRLAQQALADIRNGRRERARQRVMGIYGDAHGLVYASFTAQTHVIADTARLPPRDECEVWAGFDDGYVNPACYLHFWLHRKTATWYLVAEIHESGLLSAPLARKIRAIWAKWGTPVCIFADPAGAGRIAEMKAQGIGMVAAEKGGGSVQAQISASMQPVMDLDAMGKPHLYALATCVNFIREAGLYRWPDPAPNRNANENPVPMDNHAMDAARYCIHGVRVKALQILHARAVKAAGRRAFGG